MIAAPIPVDDAERLEALHALDLLDTPPEERFDRITRVLTLVMRVPMAYIALVDSDRQWFKSSCGLDTTETPAPSRSAVTRSCPMSRWSSRTPPWTCGSTTTRS